MSSNSNQNPSSDDPLNEIIYQQLRDLAGKLMVKERKNHTLSPTDLVHEAYVKLSGSELLFADQKHYFRTLARQMRRILVNYGRYKSAQKNQKSPVECIYTDALGLVENQPDFSHISDAIDQLSLLDERSAESIDLVYFTALEQSQAAQHLNISLRTLERDLKFGRAFINEYISNRAF